MLKAEMRRKFASGIVERPPGSDDVALGVGTGPGGVPGARPTHFANVRAFLPRITQGYVDRVQAYATVESATGTVG